MNNIYAVLTVDPKSGKSKRMLDLPPPPLPPVPSHSGPGLAIHNSVRLIQLFPDPAVPDCDPWHLGKVLRPRLYSLDMSMLPSLDNILQHLLLTALTVHMQQVHPTDPLTTLPLSLTSRAKLPPPLLDIPKVP